MTAMKKIDTDYVKTI